MFWKSKHQEPEITFVSTLEGLADDKEVLPRPAREFYPEWWRDLPSKIGVDKSLWAPGTMGTAKQCPSFIHWYNKGMVIPAWCDMSLKYNSETTEYMWTAGRQGSPYRIEPHNDDQFITYANPKIQKKEATFSFKLECPWNIITPNGWSTMVLPMFYHFNDDWSVLPGIIDTDISHQIHQQIAYFGEGQEVFIPKGGPLAHYIPFKRSKTTFDVRESTDKDKYRFASANLKTFSKRRGGYLTMERN